MKRKVDRRRYPVRSELAGRSEDAAAAGAPITRQSSTSSTAMISQSMTVRTMRMPGVGERRLAGHATPYWYGCAGTVRRGCGYRRMAGAPPYCPGWPERRTGRAGGGDCWSAVTAGAGRTALAGGRGGRPTGRGAGGAGGAGGRRRGGGARVAALVVPEGGWRCVGVAHRCSSVQRVRRRACPSVSTVPVGAGRAADCVVDHARSPRRAERRAQHEVDPSAIRGRSGRRRVARPTRRMGRAASAR